MWENCEIPFTILYWIPTQMEFYLSFFLFFLACKRFSVWVNASHNSYLSFIVAFSVKVCAVSMQPADVFILQRIAVYSEWRYRSICNARQIIQAFCRYLAPSACYFKCNFAMSLLPWMAHRSFRFVVAIKKERKRKIVYLILLHEWTIEHIVSRLHIFSIDPWALHFHYSNYGHQVHSRKLNCERFLDFDSRFLRLLGDYVRNIVFFSLCTYPFHCVAWKYWFNHFYRTAFESHKIKL